MTTRDEPWPQGTPCWVDLMVPDVAAAGAFYGELFGWQLHDTPEEAGGYVIARLDGWPVAGLGPLPEGADVPPAWTTYLAADDLDAVTARVGRHGGRIVVPPTDVMDQGRMAVAADPAGAAFGLWQSKAHHGAGVVNQPGALTWNECMTSDYDAAREFYADVFAYQGEEVGDGDFRYTVLEVDRRAVCGLGDLDSAPEGLADAPPHWMAYFAVADTDATVEQATGLGAQTLVAPRDTPYGRMAVLVGPQGEVFAVLAG